MMPTLRQGDIVNVAPRKSWRPGDIILVQRDQEMILHRVLANTAWGIITKGDALDHFDPPVAQTEILGLAVSRERQGKEKALCSFWSRYCGLAFSVTLSWVPYLLTFLWAGLRCGPEKLRRSLLQM
jgi:hypothetical protein